MDKQKENVIRETSRGEEKKWKRKNWHLMPLAFHQIFQKKISTFVPPFRPVHSVHSLRRFVSQHAVYYLILLPAK